MSLLRPWDERCVFAVAYKIIARARRPARAQRLQLAFLSEADIGGLALSSLERWRAWGSPRIKGLDRSDATQAAQEALSGLQALLRRLCRLYGVGVREEDWPEIPLAVLEGGPPRPYEPAPARPGPVADASGADLEFFLGLLFGKPGFRPGQREAVARLLEGRDAFVLLPTGSGKSLIYQLAGMLLPGVCLVVEPTLSLITDQAGSLRRSGIGRTAAITSEMDDAASRSRSLGAFIRGECLFFFASPERLQTPEFRRAMRLAAAGPGINLTAVDEAHCVSEWGHDFRTAYLRIGRALSAVPHGPVAALTGTASDETIADAGRLLGLAAEALIAPLGPGRRELRFRIVRCASAEKQRRLVAILRLYAGRSSALAFCPHVEGAFGAQAAARALRSAGLEAGVYHGKPPRAMDEKTWRAVKGEAAERFRGQRAGILVATKAFGLGIDKPDVRATVHAALPSSPEALWQEAGRAGRDGAPADCWVLASISDARRARRLLDPRTPHARVLSEIQATPSDRADDVTRALAMHLSCFRGPARELEDALEIFGRLRPGLTPVIRRLRMPSQHQGLVEKALHLLERAGVVADYAVRYGAAEFVVRLNGAGPEGIAKEGVTRRLEEIVAAVYAEIEPSRRQALAAVVESCLAGDGEELKRRVAARLAVQYPSESESGEPTAGGSFGALGFQPRSWSIWKKALKKATRAASAMKLTFSKLLFSALPV